MKNSILVSVVLFVLLFVVSQGGHEIEAAEDQSAVAEEKAAIVARVNGLDITEPMILQQINDIARESAQRFSPAQMAQKERLLFQEALERGIRYALLKNTAREKGITVDSAKLDQQLSDIRKRFSTEEEYNRALASQGLNEDRLRQILTDNLLYQKVLDAGRWTGSSVAAPGMGSRPGCGL